MLDSIPELILGLLLPAGLLLKFGTPGAVRDSPPVVVQAERGSSVLLLGGKTNCDQYTVIELNKDGGSFIVFCDGDYEVHSLYKDRGEFYKNGSFLLKNIQDTDQGLYKLFVNYTLMMKVQMYVSDPMSIPPKPGAHTPKVPSQNGDSTSRNYIYLIFILVLPVLIIFCMRRRQCLETCYNMAEHRSVQFPGNHGDKGTVQSPPASSNNTCDSVCSRQSL